MTVRILEGDVRAMLATLEPNSVQTCVTSPPYWGLRSYGTEPQVWGGDAEHAHEWQGFMRDGQSGGPSPKQVTNVGAWFGPTLQHLCPCGAWLGELGNEPTPELFVAHMVEVFRAVWRVLRPDGTLWLNLGFSYAGSNGNGYQQTMDSTNRTTGQRGNVDLRRNNGREDRGYKPKDLIPIPFLVAMALQQDGWYWRSIIAWAKKAPMPESVTDRPTSAWEPVLLMSKSARYFYDSVAVAEATNVDAISEVQSGDGEGLFNLRTTSPSNGVLPSKERAKSGGHLQGLRTCARCGMATQQGARVSDSNVSEVQRERARQGDAGSVQPIRQSQDNTETVRANASSAASPSTLPSLRETQGSNPEVLRVREGQGDDQALPANLGGQGIPTAWSPQASLFDAGQQHADGRGVGVDQGGASVCVCLVPEDGSAIDQGPSGALVEGRAARQGEHRAGLPELQQPERESPARPVAGSRNMRNFWLLSPEPFPLAHFATFVTEIPRRAILAGTSEKGQCSECGAPWERVVETEYVKSPVHGDGSQMRKRIEGTDTNGWAGMPRVARQDTTTGWRPTCGHADLAPVPQTVLDPFAGAGTTLLVADRLNRNGIGIELKADYAEMARERLMSEAPMFTELTS